MKNDVYFSRIFSYLDYYVDMSEFFINKGLNSNLYVQLSGGQGFYQIDVYVVARFRFYYSEGAINWSTAEISAWKRRFTQLVYNTWSEKWLLISDISCEPISVERGRVSLPRTRVRVHAVDVENPSVRLPTNQNIYAIGVYRQADGENRQRQWANFLEVSRATVNDARHNNLPTGTCKAELYENSLEPRNNDSDDNVQVTAMHEFGHMLGLSHPNDMQEGCMQNRNAQICYGEAYSAESASIMGRGQVVRRVDYRIFVHIVSQLIPTVLLPGSINLLNRRRRLLWSVEGTNSARCNNRTALSDNHGVSVRSPVRGVTQHGPIGMV